MREMKENLKQKKEVKWKNIKEEEKRSYKSESAGPEIRAWRCHESSAPVVTKKQEGKKEIAGECSTLFHLCKRVGSMVTVTNSRDTAITCL